MNYLSPDDDFSALSLPDLLAARDQFHLHLLHKPNVIGTAIGRYRIRKSDPWPDHRGEKRVAHKTARTLAKETSRTRRTPSHRRSTCRMAIVSPSASSWRTAMTSARSKSVTSISPRASSAAAIR